MDVQQEAKEALFSMMMKEMKIECRQTNGETHIKADCNDPFFPMCSASLLSVKSGKIPSDVLASMFLVGWANAKGFEIESWDEIIHLCTDIINKAVQCRSIKKGRA